jgi:hypothetical protein
VATFDAPALPSRIMLAQVDAVRSALSAVFLSPLGVVGLLGAVPLFVLYLLEPDPQKVALPTARFLFEDRSEDRRTPALERLERSAVLAIQLLAVLALVLALASPYVAVSAEESVTETVVVVDASASMATVVASGGETRFDRAVAAAGGVTTDRTTVVVAGARTRVPIRRGSTTAAERALSALTVSDAPGDLTDAVESATALAGEDARVVVLSDFADDGDWRTAVQVARARGLGVTLRQFDGGGGDNVGVVAVDFEDGAVTATIRNFGDDRTKKRVTLGDTTREVTVGPGGAATATLPVPDGGGTLRSTPGDSFSVDDTVPVAAPADRTVEVLLLSNGPDRRLRTALSVVDRVDLTTKRPPATVTRTYDVVIFGAVTPDRVLGGSVDAARRTLERGGGVVLQARPNVEAAGYGDLLPVDPRGVGTNATLAGDPEAPLVTDLTLPAPRRYLRAERTRGQTLVATGDGSPLLVHAKTGDGTVLYTAYAPEWSTFRYTYTYPVFWKRVVTDLSGRASLSALNRETGTRLPVEGSVETPSGTANGPLTLREVGVYRAGDRRYGVALLDRSEAAVDVSPVDAGPRAVATERTASRTVPRDLTPVAVALAALVVVLELAYLRYRGDLP